MDVKFHFMTHVKKRAPGPGVRKMTHIYKRIDGRFVFDFLRFGTYREAYKYSTCATCTSIYVLEQLGLGPLVRHSSGSTPQAAGRCLRPDETETLRGCAARPSHSQ